MRWCCERGGKVRGSFISDRKDAFYGEDPSPHGPSTRSRLGDGPTQLLPVLLLSVLLLFPSAIVLLLGAENGGQTHGYPERTAFALATGSPPVFNATPNDPTSGDSGVSIRFRIVVYDADGDTLNVTWDWGDGLNDTDLTLPANTPRTVVR